eukprot:m.94456 g.94456  ORF g.94456 m.94456 type:complete len:182 (+) comp20371_c0_seq1:42-587(+)
MGTVVSTLLAPASSLAIRESKKTLHGALMIWAWGVFIPSGMLLASIGKETFSQGIWFKLHRALGVGAAVLGTAGLITARQIGSGAAQASTHRLTGYLVSLIALAQPIIATNRPDPKKDPEGRAAWFALHKYLAWLGLLLGLYNIRTGLQMWDPKESLSLMYSSGIVAAGTVVATWNGAALM